MNQQGVKQRQLMRALIKRLHLQLQKTMIYVTHDQNEAVALADRIAVMHHAELQQVGAPEEILNNPANAFVAGFVAAKSSRPAHTLIQDRSKLSVYTVSFSTAFG